MELRRFGIVITRLGERNRLPRLPWLKERLKQHYGIDEGEWIVLTHEAWAALANGEAGITADLERKLLVTSYIHQPEVIAVVGYPAGKGEAGEGLADQTRRILRRVQDCLLPADVLAFVIDEEGEPKIVGDGAAAMADAFGRLDEASDRMDDASDRIDAGFGRLDDASALVGGIAG